MGRGSPRNGRTSTKHRQEHLIGTLLYNKGVQRKAMRLRLGIKSPQTYDKCMMNPAATLNTNQIEIIASVLEIPFGEVQALIRGAMSSKAHKWYDIDHSEVLKAADHKPSEPIIYPTR